MADRRQFSMLTANIRMRLFNDWSQASRVIDLRPSIRFLSMRS